MPRFSIFQQAPLPVGPHPPPHQNNPFLFKSMDLDGTSDDSETMGTQEKLQVVVDTLRKCSTSKSRLFTNVLRHAGHKGRDNSTPLTQSQMALKQ
jgi:hypothetical protein